MPRALRILGDAVYPPVFEADQLQTLAMLHITIDAYDVGLPFLGLTSTVYRYTWFKSRHILKTLAAIDMITSAW